MKPSACLKPKAAAIREMVAEMSPDSLISLAQAFEALADAYGFRDWNTLAAADADQVREIMLGDHHVQNKAMSRLRKRLGLSQSACRAALTLRVYPGIINKPSNAFRRCVETDSGLELGWFLDGIPRLEHEERIDLLRASFGIDSESVDVFAHPITQIPASYQFQTWFSRSTNYVGPRALLSVGVSFDEQDDKTLNRRLDREGCLPDIEFVDGEGVPSRSSILVHAHWNSRQLLVAGNGDVGVQTVTSIHELIRDHAISIALKWPPSSERQLRGIYLLRAELAKRPKVAGILPKGIALMPIEQTLKRED
jgi:hypothetical protein